MKKNKKKTRDEVHTFRTVRGAESSIKEMLNIDEDKDAVNYICSDFIDELLISDADELFDSYVYLNNHKIKNIEDELNNIKLEKLRLEKKLINLSKIETDYINKISEINKENSVYLENKKKHKEKSIRTIFNKVLLIYVKDVAEFKDVTVQEVLNEYTSIYNQNYIINSISKYLDKHFDNTITIIDEYSDNKKEYSLKLDYINIKSIKNVLNTLIIKKN